MRLSCVAGWIVAAVAACLCSSTLAEEPFDYFRNSWNVIGLKDYKHGTRLTPDNQLLLAKGDRLRLRIGQQQSTLSRDQTKIPLEGWLPVFLVTAQEGAVRYEFTLWATPLPSVRDWQKAFDWPSEGENFLNWIRVRITNTGKEQALARLIAEHLGASPGKVSRNEWNVAPGQTVETVLRVPFERLADAKAFEKEDPQLWLDRTIAYWHGVLAPAARIEVPCPKATQTLRAAHVCQLIANDHGQLHGGEGFYDEFYIRDGGYQIMELEEAGLADAAAKAIKDYLNHQLADGRFESQKGQFDANGQNVWVLWQYSKITGDRAWLARAYPQMRRAAEWAVKARRQAPADSPYAGVLPAAVADGENLWDGKHHIVGYDLWNLRAVLLTADAAQILGRTEEAESLAKEAEAYRAAIDAAWKRTREAHFPPSWEKAGTHWGNTETLWPTPIFALDDPRVTATIDHARHTLGSGFVEGCIRWMGVPDAIHPYMSAYTTMASLARDDHEQVVEDFYWYLVHSTAAHAFPEGIYYKRRFAWSDTIPHVTGASNYSLILRHMLLDERGDELHLLAAVPDAWLAEGQEILIERAPTHFGPMNLRVRGAASGVEVQLAPPKRNSPKKIVLHLPQSRPLVGSLKGVEVVARSDQKKRWDFATVVGLYQKTAPPVWVPIPGLVTLPVDPPCKAEACRTLDLAPLANTDPFTAPFGVPKPGKFLFTGLATGRQTVAGIPFEILDPAKNSGRGLVVLHSPNAPQDRPWPKEVEIAVGQQGRRLYLLGNVGGWTGGDPGAGPAEAVAEYVICYTDGQKQVVPLVPGRTFDDWAGKPTASDVPVGLRGDPWHLNVLGVNLQPKPIEKIIFRDLGTVSAPVLAAVTLER